MKSDKNNHEFGFIDNDTPENLKLDLPPEEIDNLPHIRLKKLRKGEKVHCLSCKVGYMQPIGNYDMAMTFVCDKCKNQMIIN